MVRFTWPQTCNILSLCCRSRQLDSGALIRTEPFASPIRTSKNYTFQQFCFFAALMLLCVRLRLVMLFQTSGKAEFFFASEVFSLRATSEVNFGEREAMWKFWSAQRCLLLASANTRKVKINFFSVSGVSIFPSIVVVVRFVNVILAHFPLFVKTNSSLQPST